MAENVAAGYPTPAEVVAGWIASPRHYNNILSQDEDGNPTGTTEIGIGYAYCSDTTYGHYWTADFGAPD